MVRSIWVLVFISICFFSHSGPYEDAVILKSDEFSSAREEFYMDGFLSVYGRVVDLNGIVESDVWKLNGRFVHSLIVVADTVVVPDVFDISGMKLTILARNVISEGGGKSLLQFDFHDSDYAEAVIIADFLDPSVSMRSMDKGSIHNNYYFPKLGDEDIGVEFMYDAGDVLLGSMNGIDRSLVYIPDDFYVRYFSDAYKVASLVYNGYPDLSSGILSWSVRVLSSGYSDLTLESGLLDIYLQSASLNLFFCANNIAGESGSEFVPYLDKSVFESIFVSYVDAMEAFSDQYDRFSDQSLSSSQRIYAAELMRDNLYEAVVKEGDIADFIKSELDILRQEKIVLEERIRKNMQDVDASRLDFEIAISQKSSGLPLNAIIDVLDSGRSVFLGAVSIYAGDVTGVSDIYDGASGVKGTYDKLSESIGDIGDYLESISKIQELINDVDDSVIDGLPVGEDLKNIISGYGGVKRKLVSGVGVWDIYLLEIKNALSGAIDDGISGSDVYLFELNKMIENFKSMQSINESIVGLYARYVDVFISNSMHKRQMANVAGLIDRYSNDKSVYDDLKVFFGRRVDDLKRPAFLYLLQYKKAFKFWSLRESLVDVDVNSSYLEFKDAQRRIAEDFESALSQFYPLPQNLSRAVIDISDDRSLSDLVDSGSITFSIDLGSDVFSGKDRVRVDRVRVYVEGDGLPIGLPIKSHIKTSGVYFDRYREESFKFTSRPLFFGFEYERHGDGYSTILVDGEVDDEFNGSYYKPSAFSNWTISFPSKQNPTLDLKKVKNVIVEISGSVIYSQ